MKLLLILSLVLSGCTDAEVSKYTNLGSRFKVELYTCDNKPAQTWYSTGKVSPEQGSDGYYK